MHLIITVPSCSESLPEYMVKKNLFAIYAFATEKKLAVFSTFIYIPHINRIEVHTLHIYSVFFLFTRALCFDDIWGRWQLDLNVIVCRSFSFMKNRLKNYSCVSNTVFSSPISIPFDCWHFFLLFNFIWKFSFRFVGFCCCHNWL